MRDINLIFEFGEKGRERIGRGSTRTQFLSKGMGSSFLRQMIITVPVSAIRYSFLLKIAPRFRQKGTLEKESMNITKLALHSSPTKFESLLCP